MSDTRGAEQCDSDEVRGAVAQLGEHLLCKQGVVGSIPISSTSLSGGGGRWEREGRSKSRRWRDLVLIFGSVPRRIGGSLTIRKK